MLPEVSITKMMYSLSTGTPPIVAAQLLALIPGTEQTSHLLCQVLFCTGQLPLDNGLCIMLVTGRGILATDIDRSPLSRASFSRCSESCSCLALSSRLSTVVWPRISCSSASSRTTTPLRSIASSSMTCGSEILTITQDDGPKTTGNHVQKRQVEDVYAATATTNSWPIPGRVRKDPRVSCASFQNAAAA